MTTLRPYQQEIITRIRDAFREHRRVLLVSPVGSGKTVLFTYIAKGIYQKGKRALLLAHREELLQQISGALRQWGIVHGILTGGARGIPNTPVVVASVLTLVNRLKHWPDPDLIIADEAHHAAGGGSYHKVMQRFPNARVLGVTATPQRLDGKGLSASFDHMVIGPGVADLTAAGFLSPAEVYAPAQPNLKGIARRAGDYVKADLERAMDKPSITGDAIQHYMRLAPGKRAVAFCVSIQHAKDVAEAFRGAGIVAEHVDGGMDRETRRKAIEAFKRGAIQVLTSCDLISEGFDLPAIECAILLRPTESLALYIQQIGRSLRVMPGKEAAIILDHAGNTLRHGFIDEPRDWTLAEGIVKRAGNSESKVPIKSCPKCYAIHRPASVCPRCGHEYKAGRTVEQREGTLEKIGGADEMQVAPGADLRRQYHQLMAVARRRGYAEPQRWAFSILEQEQAKRRAQQRDAPRQALINGLTSDERQSLWDQTIGRDASVEAGARHVPYGINTGG